jgi:uncharacterized protein (UPF0333 family)
MKGQLSAEMLILIAVVLAVVAIVAMQLLKTGQSTSETIGNQSQNIIDTANTYSKGKTGAACTKPEQCLSNSCDTSTYTCS